MRSDVRMEVVYKLPLQHESDIAAARQRVREVALERGFTTSAVEALATAVSEVARNAIVHAIAGEITIRAGADAQQNKGVVVIVSDEGPGIADMQAAATDGY